MTGPAGRAKRIIRHAIPLQMGVVLLYHRVADLEADPQLLAVSPRNFAEHLQVLRQRYDPVKLGELLDGRWTKGSKPHPIAVTFDDGYADNLEQALPMLRTWAVPATFFVVAGQIGSKEEFWWDELERILLGTAALPEWLELKSDTQLLRWPIGSETTKADPTWNVLSEEADSPRQAAYRELCDLLRPQSLAMRESMVAQLRGWADVGKAGRSANRALTDDEVVALGADDLVELGAHTMTHPVLSAQPVPVQWQEIDGCKRQLEELAQGPVRSISYPFGGRSHYTRRTVELVKEAGFDLACSNFPGLIHWGTPRHEVPRFLVRNWTGDEFASRLDAQFRQ